MGITPGIAVVTRPTRMEGLLERWSTRGQARFMYRQRKVSAQTKAGNLAAAAALQLAEDEDFVELEQEDATYQQASSDTMQALDLGVPVMAVQREHLPTVHFKGMFAVVVVIGQDGLVANTAKYAGDIPIVGVNPDPARIDGVLLPYRLNNVRAAVQKVLDSQAHVNEVTLAEARLDDGQSLLAFNDLFIGAASHVSARYELHVDGRSEDQSSSGILVATGAGATGWMSSVFNMARGINSQFGSPLGEAVQPLLSREERSLLWAVREPFLSHTSGIELVTGRLNGDAVMTVESRMATGGVIFSDGVQADFLEFNGGAIANIGIAKQRARLVVPRPGQHV